MRFTISSLFFIIVSFIFFGIWAWSSFLMDSVKDGLTDNLHILTASSQTSASNTFDLITTGFGVFAALFFIIGIVLWYVADSWRDDPEYYYYR